MRSLQHLDKQAYQLVLETQNLLMGNLTIMPGY